MTTVYKVVMKHTKDVLFDFIDFDNRVRHPMSKVHLTVMGIGFLVLGFLLRESIASLLIFGGFGLLWIFLLIFRQKIAFARLSDQDEDYKNQTETEFLFGQGEMVVKNASWESDIHIRYSELNMLYFDEKNYYICRDNQELYLLPFGLFTQGDALKFREFLARKTEKEWVNTKLTLRERVKRMNQARKLADQIHDEKVKNRKNKK